MRLGFLSITTSAVLRLSFPFCFFSFFYTACVDSPDPEQELEVVTPEEEELRDIITAILELSVENLGERMPLGHSWEELAQEMHGGSDDKQFLLYEIKELIQVKRENPVTRYALEILIQWKFDVRPDPVCPWTTPGVPTREAFVRNIVDPGYRTPFLGSPERGLGLSSSLGFSSTSYNPPILPISPALQLVLPCLCIGCNVYWACLPDLLSQLPFPEGLGGIPSSLSSVGSFGDWLSAAGGEQHEIGFTGTTEIAGTSNGRNNLTVSGLPPEKCLFALAVLVGVVILDATLTGAAAMRA